jgi:hypothetical protein
MLTWFITSRQPSTSGVTDIRRVFHPASLSGKTVLTGIEKQQTVHRMANSLGLTGGGKTLVR